MNGGLGGGNGPLSSGLGDMQMSSAAHQAGYFTDGCLFGEDVHGSGHRAAIETGSHWLSLEPCAALCCHLPAFDNMVSQTFSTEQDKDPTEDQTTVPLREDI